MIQERLEKAVREGEYKRESMIIDVPMAAFGEPASRPPLPVSPTGAQPGVTRSTEDTGTTETTICTAVRGDGTRCKSLAAPPGPLCARHKRWYATLPPMLGMPYPEDAVALQDVVAQVLSMVLNREIDVQRGRVAAQLCMVLQRNLKAYQTTVREAEHEAARWVNANRVSGRPGDRVI